MDFSAALRELKDGESVKRKSWDDNSYLSLQENKLMYKSKYVLSDADNIIGSNDILADDWVVVFKLPQVGDIVKVFRNNRYGIIVNKNIVGDYIILFSDGDCMTYDLFKFSSTGKNYKELVDDLLNVIKEEEDK